MGHWVKLSVTALLLLSVLVPGAYAHTPGKEALLAGWHWRADVLLVLGILGTVYLRGWLCLRRLSARAVSTGGLLLYAGALGVLILALVSPIDALSGSRFSIHMVQHLLVVMLAPLFLLLANPLAVFLWGLPSRVRRSLGRLLRPGSPVRSLLRRATAMPVTWTLYVVNLWLWHHPYLYQRALREGWFHDLEHLLFFLTAVLFWWPVVNPAPRLHGTPSYGLRIVYLVAATLQNTLLGMVISLPERVLYPFYEAVPGLKELSPIHDQALGGGLMWVSGHMYLIPILILIAKLFGREEEELKAHPPQKLPSRV
jgi:putative membrane protein